MRSILAHVSCITIETKLQQIDLQTLIIIPYLMFSHFCILVQSVFPLLQG